MVDIANLNKPFKKGDIIIYALSVVLIVLLFFTVGIVSKDNYSGFQVLIDGEVAFIYNFEDGSSTVSKDFTQNVIKESETKYRIQTDYGFNEIEINNTQKTVKVIDSDCGPSKECMRTTTNNGVIICAPHRLVIKFNQISDGTIKIG